MFKLFKLPYEKNALEPYISSETINYHYGKHHQTYVENLNNFILWTPMENMSLKEIIASSDGVIFNNAAQVWNHNFYWNCLSPNGGWEPTWALGEKINLSFWDFKEFKSKFSDTATKNFGSGWTWLALESDWWNLEIINTDDAMTLAVWDKKPLLVIDIWEHAYYIDYKNARIKYIDAFWNLINWDFVSNNIKS